MTESNWNYFAKDVQYSNVLKERLATGVEMDSAKALATYVEQTCTGALRILDFGGGPGHYYPVLRSRYTKGAIRYLGIDIDEANVRFGSEHFRGDPAVELRVGSVLDPEPSVDRDVDCIVSANTLPHVPAIEPLLRLLATRDHVRYFVFRMLVGGECVQIKKHLREHDFEDMFDRDFQYNNIYSLAYIRHFVGSSWAVSSEDDIFDVGRLATHHIPEQDVKPFYGNRVSRAQGTMIFKGEVFMPWKFVIGRRVG